MRWGVTTKNILYHIDMLQLSHTKCTDELSEGQLTHFSLHIYDLYKWLSVMRT